MIFADFWILHVHERGQFMPNSSEGAQHQKDKNWWIRHKFILRIQNIIKNKNLNPQQSRITLSTLQWDTLYKDTWTSRKVVNWKSLHWRHQLQVKKISWFNLNENGISRGQNKKQYLYFSLSIWIYKSVPFFLKIVITLLADFIIRIKYMYM